MSFNNLLKATKKLYSTQSAIKGIKNLNSIIQNAKNDIKSNDGFNSKINIYILFNKQIRKSINFFNPTLSIKYYSSTNTSNKKIKIIKSQYSLNTNSTHTGTMDKNKDDSLNKINSNSFNLNKTASLLSKSFINQQQKELKEIKDTSEPLIKELKTRIKNKGPITLGEYMNICLFDKNYGYYSTKDHIFGEKGDFITSPEISQLFGEMLSVFIIKQLESFNNPKEFELLEFGPGKGNLALDIIRSLVQVNRISGMQYSLVEKSGKLQKLQQELLFNFLIKNKFDVTFKTIKPNEMKFIHNTTSAEIEYLEVKRKNDTSDRIDSKDEDCYFRIIWFDGIESYINLTNSNIKKLLKDNNDISKMLSQSNISLFSKTLKIDKSLKPLILYSNELFDALPVNTFSFNDNKWKEVLVGLKEKSNIGINKENITNNIDIKVSSNRITSNTNNLNSNANTIDNNLDSTSDSKNKYHLPESQYDLAFVEEADTFNIKHYLIPDITFKDMNLKKEDSFKYELSVSSVQMIAYMCIILSQRQYSSGIIIDYGEYNGFEDSLRGIINQRILKNNEILDYSGKCDLSAYVNFRLLSHIVTLFNQLENGGILKQGDFLELLGMEQRTNLLISQTHNDKEKENIIKQYERLTHEDQMGDNFKVMYIKKQDSKDLYPFISEVLDEFSIN